MVMLFRRFLAAEDGASMIEFTVVFTLLVVLAFGFVDFGYAFFQWNSASKAVQLGARRAAVSTPVAKSVMSAAPTSSPGSTVPSNSFSIVCDGATLACNGSTTDFNQTAFNAILNGDPSDATARRIGMKDIFGRLTASNVKITYAATGLGYQTRPGGPVVTITLQLQNLTFDFFFLSIIGLNQIQMPSMLSTITSEDMGTCYPKPTPSNLCP